jgi:hypothetical protein
MQKNPTKNFQATKGKSPLWNAVKTALAACDRTGLLKVLQDLYHLDKANQSLLSCAFLVESDALEKCKARIHKNLFPDLYKFRSVAEAKRAFQNIARLWGVRRICWNCMYSGVKRFPLSPWSMAMRTKAILTPLFDSMNWRSSGWHLWTKPFEMTRLTDSCACATKQTAATACAMI